MTLTRKMSIAVLSLLILIFIGSYLISLNNERNYFIQQMGSNAQDTATSLGLSLSHALVNQDKALMLSMVQAVFDRGYFSLIEVRNMEGKLLISRQQLKQKEKVPGWFKKFIQLTPPVRSSIVMSGWNQIGEIFVATDPNYALNALWDNARELIAWYVLFALLSLFIVYLFINWLLKPFKRVTEQAQGICQRQFPIQEQIPKTPEFKKVTLAMNQMVMRVKRIFKEQLEQIEKLRDQSFQDSLTNIGNRRYFLQQLTSLLSDEEEFTPGFIILVAVDGLERLNKESGFQEGDKVLCDIANVCANFWPSDTIINLSRISGSNFALLIKESDANEFVKNCDKFNEEIKKSLKSYPCQAFVAAVPYSLHQTPTELLIEADKILKHSRNEANKLSFSASINSYEPTITGEEITAALSTSKISLYNQLIVSNRDSFHREIFVRLNENGRELCAGYFMPIAEKAGKAHLVDQAVLKKVLAENLLTRFTIALNLTAETILNPQYREDYLAMLGKIPMKHRNRLHLEMNETTVLKNFSKVLLFVKALQKLNINVGIDQVGINFSPMHYLNELPINYIKLHGSLFHDITENENKQFFIHYFNEMAKTLDISVIATFIEREEQWEILQKLGVTWGQGKFISAIEPLTDVTTH
ncbi:EAL domain-containing protein [Legionella cardiaca]|uniref:EAL domain-containing protein n=1 Tax=Legionella cardiaca TaxID=1071983 RepID=A0ABY8AUP9_9GAMM|nr:EAL domain-containing protein [Legionella cardiaca]WED43886.1 EAL domain-containing protein [Legionella cardiaca]